MDEAEARRTPPRWITRATPGVARAGQTIAAAQIRRPLRPIEQFPQSLEPARPRLQIGPRRSGVRGQSIGGPPRGGVPGRPGDEGEDSPRAD